MDLRHRHPYLEPHSEDAFLTFAHRGGSKHLAENSLAAFKAASDLGYRYLETDVQITKDGVLVAFHDSKLLRTCGVDRDIAEMTVAELQEVRISGVEPIPLLKDLFEELPYAMFNIDAKSDSCVEPLIDFLRQSDSLDRVCVGSFSHRRLERIRSTLGVRVCTSASPSEVASWVLGWNRPGPSCMQVPISQSGLRIVTSRRMERSQRQGLPVHVWTVDDPAIMQDLIETGVHGIMTDEASLLKQVAEHNRIWPGVT